MSIRIVQKQTKKALGWFKLHVYDSERILVNEFASETVSTYSELSIVL